ncbi:tripartite tricarboxylate transporter substrate binding protein [Pseudacidovorax sp. RU35E]|uniref:Bug family tripartite tricarboxylate transporter substrate binding protein n=1 Tax=Pseudacidovorax sp. RU35E TaxID=1907403 RepID=UPI0009545043|nr:tripartite tricarboxylate transporter substrate binding protein BugE [Pseudacidovorax sp. RU35E]SIR51734.1 Tripartite-type tricarboxylate transporter, receptor component TctC [Pseudacidovorax sp. RU35E]
MSHCPTRRDTLKLLAAATALPWAGAHADDFPNKPVRMILPFPPGGTTDVVGRVFGEAYGKVLGQPVIIDNRAGAGGSVGARAIAQAAPDGYTIGLVTISTHGTNSAVYKSLPYDPVKDFTAITKLSAFPGVIAVNPVFPAKNFKEFMETLKAAPGRYSYASSGAGGATNLCMELFKSKTGVFITHIPYRGSGPAINDVIAGQVPILWDALPSALPFIKAGKLVAIGVASDRRSPQLPDVPTFTELGVKDYEPDLWNGIVGPARIPPEIFKRLQSAAVEAAGNPEFKARMNELGANVVASDSPGFSQAIAKDVALWKEVAKFANISLD